MSANLSPMPTPDRGTWLAGMTALCSVLGADASLPLPQRAVDAFKFATTEAAARALAKHLNGVKEHDRPGYAYNKEITGTLAGQDVIIYFGSASAVTA